MKKLTISLLALCLAVAGPAIAQIDQDPDGIGLYADLQGMNNQLLAEPGIVEVHLLATRVTGVKIQEWVAAIRIEGNARVTSISAPYEFSYASWNVDPTTYGYGVGVLPYVPCAGGALEPDNAVHLATFQLWISDTDPINLYLPDVTVGEDPNRPPPTKPFYWWRKCVDDRVLYPTIELNQSSGDPDLPVMRINGDAPVPVGPASWSGLKALYR